MDPQNALARYHINRRPAALRARLLHDFNVTHEAPNPAKFLAFRRYQSLMTHFCLARGCKTAVPCDTGAKRWNDRPCEFRLGYQARCGALTEHSVNRSVLTITTFLS